MVVLVVIVIIIVIVIVIVIVSVCVCVYVCVCVGQAKDFVALAAILTFAFGLFTNVIDVDSDSLPDAPDH